MSVGLIYEVWALPLAEPYSNFLVTENSWGMKVFKLHKFLPHFHVRVIHIVSGMTTDSGPFVKRPRSQSSIPGFLYLPQKVY